MDILGHLNSIRDSVAGCEAVILADISTRVVLCVSADARPAQERLDALCETAIRLLDSDTGRVLTRAGQTPPLEALIFTDDGIEVFLRTPDMPDEALCCICTPDADVAKVIDLARGVLNRIEAA